MTTQTLHLGLGGQITVKRADLVFLACAAAVLIPFLTLPELQEVYNQFNAQHGLLASFVKFAVLAPVGESIALRITRGIYYEAGFGLMPRAIVWGFLGIYIKLAFILFATGVPAIWAYMGVDTSHMFGHGGLDIPMVLGAFSISLCLNSLFAPMLFIIHNISDEHIRRAGGKLGGFFRPVQIESIVSQLNWSLIWNFAIKKTIPLFWIPAHTITFLLPPEQQVLMAAGLSVGLGIILASARLADSGIKRLSDPVMQDLAASSGGWAFFAQIKSGQVYLLSRHVNRKDTLVKLSIGQRFPIMYGAHGKVFAAHAEPSKRSRMVDELLTALAPEDHPSGKGELVSELDRVRAQGYATGRSLSQPSITAVSAPVFDQGDDIIGFVIDLGQFEEERLSELGCQVSRAAREISGKLAA